jgi:hypothetical protein
MYYGEQFNWSAVIPIAILNKQVTVRILTFSIHDHSYNELAHHIFSYVKERLFLIFNSKFKDDGEALKSLYGCSFLSSKNVSLAVHPNIHSKVVLIEPDIICVSSANFPCSISHETTIKICSKEAHDHYVKSAFEPLWNEAEKIP